jgi:hypothetical protein
VIKEANQFSHHGAPLLSHNRPRLDTTTHAKISEALETITDIVKCAGMFAAGGT